MIGVLTEIGDALKNNIRILSTEISHLLLCPTFFIHVYSCSSLLCTFYFCRVYVSGISSCPVHPVFFFSLNKSVQFGSVQFSSVLNRRHEETRRH